jgi:hypothetical protein
MDLAIMENGFLKKDSGFYKEREYLNCQMDQFTKDILKIKK